MSRNIKRKRIQFTNIVKNQICKQRPPLSILFPSIFPSENLYIFMVRYFETSVGIEGTPRIFNQYLPSHWLSFESQRCSVSERAVVCARCH